MSTMNTLPILTSKITPPPLAPHTLKRLRFSDNARRLSRDAQITALTAPAGFGKTTLALSMISQFNLKSEVAWLTLDTQDASLRRFLHYLQAAFNHTGSCEIDLPLPSPFSLDQAIAVLDLLLSTIETRQTKLLLVLDNCHLVLSENGEGDVHKTLAYLLAHLPPTLHCLIISRHRLNLGLSRWLLSDKLQELNKEDLAFSLEETIEYLEKTQLHYLAAELHYCHELTRGWPAALELIVKSSKNLSAELNETSLNPEALRMVAEYIGEEVFGRLSIEQQRFLLITAQVDLFCPSLAETLTGMDATEVSEALRIFLDDHLFIDELEKHDGEPWFQYHPLFSAALRHQARRNPALKAAQIIQIAGNWFDANDNAKQAAICALQIHDYPQLIKLITKHWRSFTMENRAHLLHRWGREIPDEVLLQYPQVCSMISVPAMLDDKPEFAVLCDSIAQAHFTDSKVPFFAEAMAIHAQIEFFGGKYASSLLAARKALKFLSPDDYFMRTSASQTLTLSSDMPDWLEYRNVIHAYLAPALAHGHRFYICNHYAYLSYAESILGNLTAAIECVDRATAFLDADDYSLRAIDMNVYFARMNAAYHRGAIGEAQLNQQKYALTTQAEFAFRESALCDAFEALFAYLYGDTAEACGSLAQTAQALPYAFFQIYVPLEILELIEQHSDLDLEAFLHATEPVFGHSGHWRRLRFTVAFLHDDLSLLPLLREQVAGVDALRRLDRVYGYLLLSFFEEKAGNSVGADVALGKALDEAEPERITQLFINDHPFVQPLLERLKAQGTLGAFGQGLLIKVAQIANGDAELARNDQVIGLTTRENDIIYLIVSGYSPGDIAQRLSISKATVRKHIANIYAKCGVHSRTQLLLRFQ
jgi:LuxR family maltose regulon positive regulatory protein